MPLTVEAEYQPLDVSYLKTVTSRLAIVIALLPHTSHPLPPRVLRALPLPVVAVFPWFFHAFRRRFLMHRDGVFAEQDLFEEAEAEQHQFGVVSEQFLHLGQRGPPLNWQIW